MDTCGVTQTQTTQTFTGFSGLTTVMPSLQQMFSSNLTNLLGQEVLANTQLLKLPYL